MRPIAPPKTFLAQLAGSSTTGARPGLPTPTPGATVTRTSTTALPPPSVTRSLSPPVAPRAVTPAPVPSAPTRAVLPPHLAFTPEDDAIIGGIKDPVWRERTRNLALLLKVVAARSKGGAATAPARTIAPAPAPLAVPPSPPGPSETRLFLGALARGLAWTVVLIGLVTLVFVFGVR